MKTQNEQIMDWLSRGHKMTSWQAITKYRITRLSAKIYDLKRAPFYLNISDKWVTKNGKSYKQYWLS